MNIKQTARNNLRGHASDADVNLTSVMNVFLIIIPFLLLTASFVKIAVLELNLPNLDSGPMRSAEAVPQSVILNVLLIRENGFELKSPDLIFESMPKSSMDYPWQVLTKQLNLIKQAHPESDEIIISPENTIRYEVIIHVMDRCREAGFPNVSISG